MIDDILQFLSSRQLTTDWTPCEEFSAAVREQGLSPPEVDAVEAFLAKYFLDVDEGGQRVRLNTWMQTFVQSATV